MLTVTGEFASGLRFSAETRENTALTGVRGLAAVYVAAYHLFAYAPDGFLAKRFVGRGYLAVDLFFILSGFVLAMNYGRQFSTEAERGAFGPFLLRRAARILPRYWFALGLKLALTLLILRSSMAGEVAVDLPTPLGTIANVLLVQSWASPRACSAKAGPSARRWLPI